MKSLLELVYREAYSQGFLPGDVVNGVSHPNKIFGTFEPSDFERALVARFDIYDRFRNNWVFAWDQTRFNYTQLHSSAQGMGGGFAGGCYGCLGGFCLAVGFSFAFSLPPMPAITLVGLIGGTLIGTAKYNKMPKDHKYATRAMMPDFDFAECLENVTDLESDFDIENFRSDLSKLEEATDVIRDGNISFGKRYLEKNFVK